MEKQMLKKLYLYKLLVAYVHKAMVTLNPKKEMERIYKKVFHKKPNIDHPTDLIEKIYWLQLYSDTTLWTKCADKYLVREYVKECGLEDYLPKLYGKWDSAKDITFNSLPKDYIIKSNNGCGTCLIVRNGNVNQKQARRIIDRWLKVPYGYSGSQLHYTRIKPCIIAEELLVNDDKDNKISPNSVIDYKVWCFNGEPECILIVYDRTETQTKVALYNTNWEPHPEFFSNKKNKIFLPDIVIEKPTCLSLLLDMARRLSNPFKEVRVDFYIINDKPYFGEMTFTSGFGTFTESYYEYLGSKISVENINKK